MLPVQNKYICFLDCFASGGITEYCLIKEKTSPKIIRRMYLLISYFLSVIFAVIYLIELSCYYMR